MYANLQDDPKMDDLPKVAVKTSIITKILGYLILPFLLFKLAMKIMCFVPVKDNGFTNMEKYPKLTAEKKACFSKDIPLDAIKAKSKELKEQTGIHYTLNDVVMSVLSISLK